MIVLVSLIVLLRRLLVSTIFGMVHPYITVHSFLHLFHVFCVAPVARMRKPTALRLVITCMLSSVKMASCLVARRIQCSVARFVVTGYPTLIL